MAEGGGRPPPRIVLFKGGGTPVMSEDDPLPLACEDDPLYRQRFITMDAHIDPDLRPGRSWIGRPPANEPEDDTDDDTDDDEPSRSSVATCNTTGLRHICTCEKECSVRAYYIRQAKKLRPTPLWMLKAGAWIQDFLAVLHADVPPDGTLERNQYLALWGYTLASALQRMGPEAVVDSHRNPEFIAALGGTFEHTSVAVPCPIDDGLASNYEEFKAHQACMLDHLSTVYGTSAFVPNEELPDIEANRLVMWSGEPLSSGPGENPVIEVAEAPPSEEASEGGSESQDPQEDSGSGSDTGSDATVTVVDQVEGGEESDSSATEEVQDEPSAEDTARTPHVASGSDAGTQASDQESLRGGLEAEEFREPPPKPRMADASTSTPSPARKRQGTKRSASKIHKTRVFRPTPAQVRKMLFNEPAEALKKAEPSNVVDSFRHEQIALAPRKSTVAPTYRKTFYRDDGPSRQEDFYDLAGCREAGEDQEEECCHAELKKIRRQLAFDRPDRYCQCVKAAAASEIIRHPGDWSMSAESIQVLGAMASKGLLSESLLTKTPYQPRGVADPDIRKPQSIAERYTVEVRNRFEPLVEDDELTIDVDAEDIAELTKDKARELFSSGRRPAKAADANAENRRRKQRSDQDIVSVKESKIDPTKTREQRKTDGRAALRRIAARISSSTVQPKDVALTIIEGGLSPAVTRLLEEQHPWLRSPTQSMEMGKWCWLAACIHNHIDQEITLTGILSMTKCTYELLYTGPTGWVRDLTADGDVENNPGPVTFPQTVDELKGFVPYDEWVKRKDGLGANMLTDSLAYVTQSSRPADQRDVSTNAVLVAEGTWFVGVPGNPHVRINVGTWTTQLYPTTLSPAVRKANASGLTVEQGSNTWIPSLSVTTPAKEEDVMFYHPEPDPVDLGPSEEEDDSPAPSASAQQPAAGAPAAPDQQPGPLTAATADGQPRLEDQPSNPTIVLATVKANDKVCRSSAARGNGIVIPVRGEGLLSTLETTAGDCVVLGHIDDQSVWYGAGQPVTVIKNARTGKKIYRYGGKVADKDLAAKFKILETAGGSEYPLSDVETVRVIGVWYPSGGNGATATLRMRKWGPPITTFGARVVPGRGTAVSPTALGTDIAKDIADRFVIIPRTDVVSSGLDKTTSEKLAVSPPPAVTTCEALAFKLGLMNSWARFGQKNASDVNVMTGQAQVHEPTNRIVKGSRVVRLLNSSGRPREDCGGLTRPCFPFYEGGKRGCLKFFTNSSLVPAGEPFIVLPACFERETSFRFAAVFLMAHLPFPWGNLSLALNTEEEKGTAERLQIFTWYGSTTAVPGEFNLNVVLHQTNAVDVSSKRGEDPALAIWPTTGGTAVEMWAPFSRILVNSKPRQNFFIPASAFAMSWALTYDMATVRHVLACITSCGLWNNVERWVNEAEVWVSNHAGLLVTGKSKTSPETYGKYSVLQAGAPPFKKEAAIPPMYLCWAPTGNRLAHIPSSADWADWQPAPDWRIDVPNIDTLCYVYAGFYKFDQPMGWMDLGIEDRLLAAVKFVAAERLFLAWHMLYARAGIPVEAFMGTTLKADMTKGESIFVLSLFGGGEGDPRAGAATVDGVLSQTLKGALLTCHDGSRMLDLLLPPRYWAPQVYENDKGASLKKICPTPVTDIFLYKYLPDVPRELAPFVVTNQALGNCDYLDGTDDGRPPLGYVGPFIYNRNGPYDYVEFDDVVEVAEETFWQNRLMHTQACYMLRRYRDGEIEDGAPRAGHAPVMVVRGSDDWAGAPMEISLGAWPYPFFSSQWSGWVAFDSHCVTALLASGRMDPWISLLRKGVDGLSAGVMFDPSKPPYPVQMGRGGLGGPGLKKFLTLTGNAKREETPKNTRESSDPDVNAQSKSGAALAAQTKTGPGLLPPGNQDGGVGGPKTGEP